MVRLYVSSNLLGFLNRASLYVLSNWHSFKALFLFFFFFNNACPAEPTTRDIFTANKSYWYIWISWIPNFFLSLYLIPFSFQSTSWLITEWRDGQIERRTYGWLVDGQTDVAGGKGRRDLECSIVVCVLVMLCFPAAWPWAVYASSFCVSFLTCEKVIIIVPQDCKGENELCEVLQLVSVAW